MCIEILSKVVVFFTTFLKIFIGGNMCVCSGFIYMYYSTEGVDCDNWNFSFFPPIANNISPGTIWAFFSIASLYFGSFVTTTRVSNERLKRLDLARPQRPSR